MLVEQNPSVDFSPEKLANMPIGRERIHWNWCVRPGSTPVDFPEDSKPLIIAAFNGDIKIAQLLLDHGAIVHSADQEFNTPLHFAVYHRSTAMVGLLLDAGANLNAVDSNHQNRILSVPI